MSAEWATFWAIVFIGTLALYSLSLIYDRLNSILGEIRGARFQQERETNPSRLP